MTQQEKERLNFCIGIIGDNRTGKSATAKSIANAWKESRPEGVIISNDPQNNFTDISDAFIDPEDPDWCFRLHKVRNALIILDDFGLLTDDKRSIPGLRKLLYYRAQWNIDILYIVHNPAILINTMVFFTSYYYIFYTNVQEGGFKKKIPNYSLCQAASARVNNYVSIFGRGKYDEVANRPKFPHIIIDCQNRVLKAINMDRQLSKINLEKK